MNGPIIDDRPQQALLELVRLYPAGVKAVQGWLFRQHLALNVIRATPLLSIVSRLEGVDFNSLVRQITPPSRWPTRPLPNNALTTSIGVERSFEFGPSQIHRRHRVAGKLLAGMGQRGDALGVRVVADGLELTAVVGSLKVETFHGFARIQLEHALPETVAVAAVGRFVVDLIWHPWFEGTDWRVVDVHCASAMRTLVTFDTGMVDWRTPWRADPILGTLKMEERDVDGQ
jgi:hypothetical protein